MLKNYIKIAWRNLRKDKLITAINILGLSIGLACCILTFLFVKNEWSFDKFHREAENIYRVSAKYQSFFLSVTPVPLAPALQDEFASITESMRLDEREVIVQVNGQYYKEKTLFADSNFFTFFSFPVLQGDPKRVLERPEGLVITQTFAQKYFPGESPLGKMIRINLDSVFSEYQISGVSADPPRNSTIQYDMVMPLINDFRGPDKEEMTSWKSFGSTSFVRVDQRANIENIRKLLPGFISKHMGKDLNQIEESTQDYTFLFKPLVEYHLNGTGGGAGMEEPISKYYLYALAIIGILVLIIACFNFMNLTNAKASGRLKEIGIRKVIGAQRANLIWQFWLEAIFLSFIATAFAMVLADLFLPALNQISGYEMSIELWRDPFVIPGLIVLALITGILAGSYPAVALSAIETLDTFKSNFKIGGNNWLTRFSLVFQFGLSIALITGAILIKQQQDFIQDANLGFSEEQVIVVPLQLGKEPKGTGKRLVRQFKQKLTSDPAISKLSGVSSSFSRGSSISLIEGKNDEQVYIFEFNIDQNYLDLLEIGLIEGENFKSEAPTKDIIVNEAFLKQFKIDNPIGHILNEDVASEKNQRIIGVVKDYHFVNLRSEIRPLRLFHNDYSRYNYLLVKTEPGKIEEALNQIKATWTEVRPQKPFEYHFLDEDIGKEYASEKRWGKAITIASILSIFIACIGLFGLTMLAALRRTKEIGIRKVLGASYRHIIILLSRQFLWLDPDFQYYRLALGLVGRLINGWKTLPIRLRLVIGYLAFGAVFW